MIGNRAFGREKKDSVTAPNHNFPADDLDAPVEQVQQESRERADRRITRPVRRSRRHDAVPGRRVGPSAVSK